MATVITFDLDDTLYLERDFVRSGFIAADSWVRDRFAVAGFFDTAWTLFEAGRRGDIFDRALAALNVRVSPEIVRQIVDIYRGHTPSIQLAADAEEALTYLCARRRITLVTDGYRNTQARKVEALGLVGRFEQIVYTDELGRGKWKPHPEGFRAIQSEFGLAAQEFVYVADNPQKDFIAPRQLGWKTVRVRRPEGQYARLCAEPRLEPDYTVTSLRELDLAAL
jgi:putative hydrolase of the HAD superfamily